MDKEIRNRIQRATQSVRTLLETEFSEQLEGLFDIGLHGTIANVPGDHLDGPQRVLRAKLVAAIEHEMAGGIAAAEAVGAYLREAAFTALNRFVALKMLEARGLVQECISKGDQSSGFKEFTGLAAGLLQLPDRGYRLYIESLFDEIGREVRVLFDRRDPGSLLWPRRQALQDVLEILNATELASVWNEDETIGWVYQYFNSDDERRQMRAESQAPRNSRELAVRNEFFTPRYVVQFLTDNTLGRLWYEIRGGDTKLANLEFLVHRPNERFVAEGEDPPAGTSIEEGTSAEERQIEKPVGVPVRPKKDPRDLCVLDPACGSGHFLLYAFDLLLTIYEEAWADTDSPPCEESGRTLSEDYPDLTALRHKAPVLILRHNLHGIDIDLRCTQIAAFALWTRAHRVYEDAGIARGERSPIERTNIVLAEPLPGEPDLREEFVASLDGELGELVNRVFDGLELAGEMGPLLRIEEKIRLALGNIYGDHGRLFRTTDAERWNSAERELLGALRTLCERVTNGRGFQRRLFVGDTERGLGLVQICRNKYDVVLMNPPFGGTTKRTHQEISRLYPDTRLDLFAIFVERGIEMLQPNGLLGAFTPRDGFFKKSLSGWRNLVQKHSMTCVADFGLGVLDSATVRTAAYCVRRREGYVTTQFFDLIHSAQPAVELREKIRKGKPDYIRRLDGFKKLPLGRFLYAAPARVMQLYHTLKRLENESCTPRYGLTTLDDTRFCRLFWEVAPNNLGPNREWAYMTKGGDEMLFGGISPWIVRWADGASEMAEVNRQNNGQIAQTRRASKFYFRPAVAFPNRAVSFSVRWHPSNFTFSVRGPVIVPLSASILYLLGFFGSRLAQVLIEMQTASDTYTSGVLKDLPWVEPNKNQREKITAIATTLFQRARRVCATDETDQFFSTVFLTDPSLGAEGWLKAERNWYKQVRRDNAREQKWLDAGILEIYGLSAKDLEFGEAMRDETNSSGENFGWPCVPTQEELARKLLRYLVGCSLGLFSLRCRPITHEDVPEVSDAAPYVQPAASRQMQMIQFCCDDPGHEHDLVDRVLGNARILWPELHEESIQHLVKILGFDEGLRVWTRKELFGDVIRTYSRTGRRAPAHIQIATPSSSYSVWMRYADINSDALYVLRNDFILPKIAYEERVFASLAKESDELPSGTSRRTMGLQDDFLHELRALRDEVGLVAALWDPHLDDGIVINFAPLWRLFSHQRDWQTSCKATWDKLCKGDHDWAHQAMHLWPERVIPKCAEDRSLAIAHGLGNAFWYKDTDGKWIPRNVHPSEVRALIRQRRSPAVEEALKKLLEAPAPKANRTSRKSTARTSTRRGRTATPRQDIAGSEHGSGPKSPVPVDEALLAKVRSVIAANGGESNKSDVIEATGITSGQWNRVIKTLLANGTVTQSGERRGARYRLAGANA